MLRADEGEIILMDLAANGSDRECSSRIASQVKEVLRDHERLYAVAEKAMVKSRSWDEAANAKELTEIILQGM